MTDQQFQDRISRLKRFGWVALFGIVLVAALASIADSGSGLVIPLAILAALCIVPALFYFVALTIWHWKGRYRGTHGDIWGVLLVIETSGWFKLIYFFRHIIPDAKRQGRYSPSIDASGT